MKARYTNIDGQVVAERRAGVRSLYVPDAIGSTSAIAISQTVTDTFSYWPYGEVRARTGYTATQFRFCGTLGCRQGDRGYYVLGLSSNAILGRWLSPDAFPLSGITTSRYLLCSGNPASQVELLSLIGLGAPGSLTRISLPNASRAPAPPLLGCGKKSDCDTEPFAPCKNSCKKLGALWCYCPDAGNPSKADPTLVAYDCPNGSAETTASAKCCRTHTTMKAYSACMASENAKLGSKRFYCCLDLNPHRACSGGPPIA